MRIQAAHALVNAELQASALSEALRWLLPVEDFATAESHCDLHAELGLSTVEEIARGLFRQRKGHVILTGDRGVGKTTLVRRLATETARGRLPFFSGRRFIRLDVSNVGPEDSRACLEAIFTSVAEADKLVLCLDGLAALIPRAHGGTNKPLLRTMFQREGTKIIGIMTDWEYAEHIGGDAQMLPLVSRVRLQEPREEEAREIARSAARQLERTFAVNIPDEIVNRAVALSSTFLLNERHPAKGINVLQHACENVRYDAAEQNGKRLALEESDLICSLAELTDLPQETISGEGAACDFDAALRQVVVGQDDAVREVATELRLITAGLTEPDKPASVMMFAGCHGRASSVARALADRGTSFIAVNGHAKTLAAQSGRQCYPPPAINGSIETKTGLREEAGCG